MNSLRVRMTAWFTGSLLVVLGVYIGVTYLHLQHELRIEKWEREHPDRSDWVLHGSYSQAEVDDIAGELWRLSLFYALPVAAVAVGVGYFLALRSLRPLTELDQQLKAIGARNLSLRVHLTRADREFQAMEANINELLARLENSFRQLTEFSAQVAHEVRAPLTLLRLQIEDSAGRIEPALAESIQEELGRLSDYVDQSLLLATAQQGRLQLKVEHVPLHATLRDLLETYELWARSQQRTIEFVASTEPVLAADTRYVRQMLHILLTNAMRHGAGPIRVELVTVPNAASCRITNGIPSRASPTTGNGLGLRLAHALASAQGCALSTSSTADAFTAEIRWSTWAPSHG